jgi:pimeloyl-ACP methyl ester carboxylesterase
MHSDHSSRPGRARPTRDDASVNAPVELRIPTPLGELAALAWGAADAPVLLALHGWLDNAASFVRLAPRVASHRHVIAMDLPGHGRSAHLPAGVRRYHFLDQIDTVLECADALGLDTFDLLGHSLGAGVATLVAAAAPQRVRRLALIEGLGPLADDGAQTLTRWRDAAAQRTRDRRPPRVFASTDAAVAARVAAGGLSADEARPIVARNLTAVDTGCIWRSDARLRLTTPLRIEEAQVRRLLAGITVPTWLLLAEPATPYLPSPLMQARAACVAGIRIEHLAGPHHLHIRQPQAVAQSLVKFLQPR